MVISDTLPLCNHAFRHTESISSGGRNHLMILASALMSSVVNDSKRCGEHDVMLEKRFMSIVDRHNALITKICFYFASDTVEFDDLRQDSLLNIWRGLKGFRGDSRESTWIYRICFNTCMSTVKRNKNGSMPSLDYAGVDICDPSDEEHEENERIVLLHRCISQLNPIDRSIVMMQLDGNSYDEISNVIGLNRNTVATRLARAKKKLLKLFESMG